jgi:nucleoside-diphosphate-sugar epimerase
MQYSFLKNKSILITGGAGFIGHNLLKTIIKEEPKHVYVLDNLETGLEENVLNYLGNANFTFIKEDVADPHSTKSINSLDYIFHLAAIVSVPKSFELPFKTHRTNESGFIHMLELAKQHNVKKICYASSSAIYGEQGSIPINEEASLNPQSPYGLSKLLNEQYARAFYEWEGIASIGFRFFNVFGPGQRADSPYSGVISIFKDRMQKKERIQIFGDGEQIRDFVYVEDVVQALLRGAGSSVNFGLYNVGSGYTTSLNQLFHTLYKLTNYREQPQFANFRKGDIKRSAADISLIQSELGYEPKYNLKEGLVKLIEFN